MLFAVFSSRGKLLMRWLVLSLLCAALLASCTVQVSPTYPAVPASPTHKVEATFTPKPISEITLPTSTPNPECLPPCFYGIMPGRTTVTETAALLGVSNPSHEALTWETRAPRRPWYASNRYLPNQIWFDNDVVSSIAIHEQEDLTLQEIVDKYGAPEAVTIGNPDIYNLADFILIYASRGVAFLGKFQPGEIPDEQIAPTQGILVDSEVYFPPMPAASLTPEIVVSWRMGASVESIYPWRGFGHPVAAP